METKYLRCPRCENSLVLKDCGYLCEKCGSTYAVSHGVPVLIPGISVEPSNFQLSKVLVDQILAREQIPGCEENRERLQEIFSQNYQLSEFLLTAENNFYLKRIGLKVEGYREQHDPDEAAKRGRVGYSIRSHMIPPAIPAGELRSWNIRLENEGERTFFCKGSRAFFLTYQWVDAKGEVLSLDSERTALPVDISAGRGITIPLWINPPLDSGRYVLEIRLDQDGKDWESSGRLCLNLMVGAEWVSSVPGNWLTLHRAPDTYNYQVDHEIGRVFLKEELAIAGQSCEKVLEIGGCCNPMTWDLPCQVVSADIDVQTLQVGALHFSKIRPNVEFFAADAHRLPFVDGVFDCAVMFATLHHFLDPAACLTELMRVVKPDGFISILCEPIGSYRAETLSEEFKADLEEGINEQIFTPEEYGQIFIQAGLVASRAMIDGGSFKAILRRIKVQSVSVNETGEEADSALVQQAVSGRSWLRRAVGRLVGP